MIRINNVKLKLDDAKDLETEKKSLNERIVIKYKIPANQILDFNIYKKAIDARKKNNVHFVYTIDVKVKNEDKLLTKSKFLTKAKRSEYEDIPMGSKSLINRPVIVGFGPSGLFSGLLLARRGYKPIILERGYDVARRTKEWNTFNKTAVFNENASVLFGEGGAGTFSDGKLTTSVKNVRCRYVLRELIKAGADPKILYMNKPHVGTDVLKKVVKNMREEIIALGGDVRFESKVTDFIIEGNQLTGLVVNGQEEIKTNSCLLGIGHSARDTFDTLLNSGLEMSQKPFSVGVRIEHNQKMINKSQYGDFHDHPALGAAEYKLTYHAPSGRSAYTFCMCPGGYVVSSISEPNTVVTNGMSYSKRNGSNANSALLVNVTPEDFPSDHPLAGIEFQRAFEKKAFDLAGKNYYNPLQLVGDFFENKNSTSLGSVKHTIKPGFSFVKMQDIYPPYIIETMKEALLSFDRKIKGFASKDAVLTGPETRSSSPVKISRDETHQSNILGLYPMGEGPGYAGGIMSAAVDGIKTAEKIIEQYNNLV